MKKLISLLLFAAITAAISGCVTQNLQTPSVALGTREPTDNLTYSVAPFLDANSEINKQTYPDATNVVHAAVESALIKYGKNVVQDNGDIELTGIVTAYYQGKFLGPFTIVGIDLEVASY
jgi:hypothetical protein